MRRSVLTVPLLAALLSTGCAEATGPDKAAILATIQSDLLRLVAAEDSFHTLYGDYAGSIDPGFVTPGTGGAGVVVFNPTPGNVLTLNYRSDSSWSATMVNAFQANSSSYDWCAVFVGPPPAELAEAVTASRTTGCSYYAN